MKRTKAPMSNKFEADCAKCHTKVPVGQGILTRAMKGWQVTHAPARWVGSPVSGKFVGGCPDPAPAEESN